MDGLEGNLTRNPIFHGSLGLQLFGDVFFRLGNVFWIYGSVHFPCYLQNFEPGSCYFHNIYSILDFEPFFVCIVFASSSLNLQHFGAGSCHFSGLDFYMIVPQFSLILTWFSLIFVKFWLIFGNT